VDTDELDDDQPHASRNKGSVATAINDAAFKGIFGGWESEGQGQDVPRPIFQHVGVPQKLTYSAERRKLAEKAVGCKLTPNSTWIFPHFDCYIQVKTLLAATK
jgi:hypothetical protein